MHIRPRCREWLPLAAQQLRLRNLVRIHGFNIAYADSNSLIYYTLHHAQQSEEFYKSEALPARQQHQKWAEIACIEMLKSNLNCVSVKVWEQPAHPVLAHMQQPGVAQNPVGVAGDQEQIGTQYSLPPRPLDKLLFTWGVYFSGLIPISQELEPANCLQNTLVFQLHGDYFTSAEHFKPDALREQLAVSYRQLVTANEPERGTPLSDGFCINSPKASRSSSPTTFAAYLNDETSRDLLTMSKARYTDLHCSHAEIRRSYHLDKLLEIQELQRLRVQKSNEILEISSEIKQRCVRCITAEQLGRKNRTLSSCASVLQHHQHHSMGRALSLLLSEQQQQSDPKTLLRVQRLQQQMESLRSRRCMLEAEFDFYTERISQLRLHFSTLSQTREQLQSSLQERRAQLEIEKKNLEDRLRTLQEQFHIKRRVERNVRRRMSSLCMELREIYPIYPKICGIPFACLDAYLNNPLYVMAEAANITPMALSASLGYIAHFVQMMAVIFNKPLRNPILHEGSRTRIVDIVQDLPHSSREFPLYSRSIILSKPVKYAVHLLNQNIAQLCYEITGVRRDLRATIQNISHIFTALSEVEQQTGGIRQRIVIDSLSNSHSSVDLNNVATPNFSAMTTTLLPSSMPLLIAERHMPQQRICRSVGSYSDCEDDFKDITDHCYSNSDSNITNQKFAK